MNEFPVLVERSLKFQLVPNGVLSDVVIQVGYPAWVEPNLEAACPVAIHGMEGRIPKIRGVDQMDAIKNALLFIENYLTDRGDKGKFFWPNGDEY